MGEFKYAEKADMHYMYSRANGNGRGGIRMYAFFYSTNAELQNFQRVHLQLDETGSFHLTRHVAGR